VHVMVAWDIKAAEPLRSEIRTALLQALHGYSWVRALGSVYIVKVGSPEARDRVGEALKDVARNFGGVNIIYSPAMEGGQYNGWLPKALWPRIRQRVDDV
jgi:hypothetical protein